MQAGHQWQGCKTVNSWCFCWGDNPVLATTHTLTLACTSEAHWVTISTFKYPQVQKSTHENSKLFQYAQTVNRWYFCCVYHFQWNTQPNTYTCMYPPVYSWHLYPQVLKTNYQKGQVPTGVDKYPQKLKTTWKRTHKYSDWKQPFKIQTGPVLPHSVDAPSLTSMAFQVIS